MGDDMKGKINLGPCLICVRSIPLGTADSLSLQVEEATDEEVALLCSAREIVLISLAVADPPRRMKIRRECDHCIHALGRCDFEPGSRECNLRYGDFLRGKRRLYTYTVRQAAG